MLFFLEMVIRSWYGFVRVEEVFDEFFYFIDGLGSVDIDDGGG